MQRSNLAHMKMWEKKKEEKTFLFEMYYLNVLLTTRRIYPVLHEPEILL